MREDDHLDKVRGRYLTLKTEPVFKLGNMLDGLYD